MLVEIDDYELRCLYAQINKLSKELKEKENINHSLNFRIETELEPRLKRERESYDSFVCTDHSVEACETFCDLVNRLLDMVKENPYYYEWEDTYGDLPERILYLIKGAINEQES